MICLGRPDFAKSLCQQRV